MIGQNGRCPSPTASPAAIRTTVPGNKVPADTAAISTGPNRSREYLHGIDLFNHGFYWGLMKPGKDSGSHAAAVAQPRLTCRHSTLPPPALRREYEGKRR
jgi:hypothetical protein